MSRRFRPSNLLRIGCAGRSFPNHNVPASNGGFAKGSPGRESREAAIGYTEGERLLFVVHVIRHEETIRISAREATREERRQYQNPCANNAKTS
jgi:hypothetical protein